MNAAIVALCDVCLGCMLGDLAVAMFHWFEDNYLPVKRYRFPMLEGLALHNEIHHARPRDILRYSVWINMRDPSIAGAILASSIVLATGRWVTATSLLVTLALTQPIHRFQHMTARERPAIAKVLFKTGLFVSPDAHHVHHTSPVCNFGIVFAPMNRFYEATSIWRHLEACVLPWWGPPVPK